MFWRVVLYIIYGLITGTAEILPVSASAQGYLLSYLTRFDTREPLMLLCIHLAVLGVLLIHCRHRIAHIRREVRIERLPLKRRKRQPDRIAVLDGKVIIGGLLPIAVCLLLGNSVYAFTSRLPVLTLLLVAGGVMVYIPQYVRGGNRDSRHLSRYEGILLGFSAGSGAVPGLSRMGMMISAGLLRGCDHGYIVDIALLASVPAMVILIIIDSIAVLAAGIAGITAVQLLLSLLSGAAAFGGAWLGIMVLKYLSVNANYSAFAYYSWGLAMFSFILYLMV